MKLLCVDTQTGGLTENYSLLAIGLGIWDNGLIRGTKEIKIKNDPIVISPSILKHINLDDYKHGITLEKARSEFKNFLIKNFANHERIMLLGHNTQFDVKFLKQFLGEKEFELLFGTQVIDTCIIVRYLIQAGKFPEDVDVCNIWQYFEIERDSSDSENGVITTCKLYNKLLEIVK